MGKHSMYELDFNDKSLYQPTPPPQIIVTPTPQVESRWGLRQDGRLIMGAALGCLLLPFL